MPYYCKTCRHYKWHKYENPDNRGFHYCERLNNETSRAELEEKCGGNFYQIIEPPEVNRMQPAVRLLINVYADSEETIKTILNASKAGDVSTISGALDNLLKYIRRIKKDLKQ